MQVGWRQPVDVSGLTWTEPHELGGRQLVSVEHIKSTRALLDIVRGQQFDVMVSQPYVDCSIDAKSGELHINQVLQVESSPLRFTAEGQLLNGHAFVSNGILQVPEEFRQVVGEDFHATVIIGAENLKTEAEDFGIDAEWAQTEGKPHGNAAAGTPLDPTAVVINSQHVSAQLSGWRTASGMLLREPATASIDYTPALAKYGLQRISPLLSNVVAVQEGGQVQMSWAPEGLTLPAEKSTLQIEPMKLVVGRGDFASRIVKLLGLKDRTWSKSSLQAWTSTIAVDLHPEGAVRTQRLDILLGPGHGHTGVHLCMWGSVDPTNDSALDMTLGFPADTLRSAGLTGIPEDGMLTVKVTGTAEKPKIDWAGAYNKLTSSALSWQPKSAAGDEAVSLKQAVANKALQGLGRLHHRVTAPKGGAADAGAAAVPPPVAPLPWEQ